MDPNATLEEMRERAENLLNAADEGFANIDAFNAERLAELVVALDDWLCKGGFLPAKWEV